MSLTKLWRAVTRYDSYMLVWLCGHHSIYFGLWNTCVSFESKYIDKVDVKWNQLKKKHWTIDKKCESLAVLWMQPKLNHVWHDKTHVCFIAYMYYIKWNSM